MKFKKIYLEISNICNLQCSFCPVVERDKAVLDEAQLRKYLSKIKDHAERICFHVMGEPLGHKDFPLFVNIAEDFGVELEITTNGTLLNEANQQALLKPAVVQVNFSIQSFFDNFPKADPIKYIQNIILFSDKAIATRPELYINYRLWNISEQDTQKEPTEIFIQKIEQHFEKKINRQVDPAFKKSKKIKGRIYLHFDTRFEWPDSKSEIRSLKGTCYGTRNHIAVTANGTVIPCCLAKEEQINLGSLETQSLDEILVSERFLKMKQGFENGILVEDFCQRCTFIERFD